MTENNFQRRCVRPECPNLVPLDRLKRKGITCSRLCARIDRLAYMKFKRHLRSPKARTSKSEQMHTVREALPTEKPYLSGIPGFDIDF